MAEQGCNEEEIAQIQEGLAAARETGAELERPRDLWLLAQVCKEMDRLNDGLSALTEAPASADAREERNYDIGSKASCC
jgi:hypothetical protein